MIKSNVGLGTVSNCTFENFIGHSNAYSLNINAYWTQLALQSGDGVLYQDLSFINWSGAASNGVSRAPVNVIRPDDMLCEGLGIEEFEVCTETGDTIFTSALMRLGAGHV